MLAIQGKLSEVIILHTKDGDIKIFINELRSVGCKMGFDLPDTVELERRKREASDGR